MPDLDRLAQPLLVGALLAIGALAPIANAEPTPAPGSESPMRPDIPAGVRGADLLRAGEFSFGYRYERESRNGNRNGTRRETVADVRSRGFTFVSTSLDWESHTFELMYAPIDRITLAAELPLVRIDAKYRAPDGTSFTTRANGVGDLRLGGRFRFMRKGSESLDFHLGFEFPTGSIQARDNSPTVRSRLPYALQVGSGTVNFLPAATYMGRWQATSWGVQASAAFHLGKNDEDWNRGDWWQVTGWLSQRWFGILGSSIRIAWTEVDNVRGRDKFLDPTLQPTNDPNHQGGARLDLGPGLTVAIPWLGEQTFSVEASWPVYQSLDGPQLERDWKLNAGLRWAF